MSNTQDTCSVSLLFALIVIPSSIVPVTLFSPYTVFNTSTFSTSKSFNLNVSALLVIYGPVVNPQVIIGDKSYLVNIVLEQGERLEIDSRTRTVTKISKNGEQVNAFHNREKGKKFFKKIPPGRQKVVWSGKFDWDLVIYEERSEPRWSGWKQR